MEPLVIVEEGAGIQHAWTHLINLELLADYHGRSPAQLMDYLKRSLNSMGVHENKLYGSFNAKLIANVLNVMSVFDQAQKKRRV